jgi:hypothetical protein
MVKLGKPDPGPLRRAFTFGVTTLARDPSMRWEELLPYFMHDMNTYGSWLEKNNLKGPYYTCTAEELKSSGVYRVLSPAAYVEELRGMGSTAVAFFQPMAGGIPPALAWETLQLFETDVVPALQS